MFIWHQDQPSQVHRLLWRSSNVPFFLMEKYMYGFTWTVHAWKKNLHNNFRRRTPVLNLKRKSAKRFGANVASQRDKWTPIRHIFLYSLLTRFHWVWEYASVIVLIQFVISGSGSSVGIASELLAGRSGIGYRWGRDFSLVFPGGRGDQGMGLVPHPHLVYRGPRKSRAMPLLTLRAFVAYKRAKNQP